MPPTPTAVTQADAAEHGLTPAEYARICEALGRAPNLAELGVLVGDVVGALQLQELARAC